MSVAQGSVWSDTIGPIIDSGGAVVSNAVSAGQLTITALYDSAGADQKAGCALTYLGNGVYQVSKTLSGSAALGNWTLVATWNNTVEPARTYIGGIEVVTAQQKDPMAAVLVNSLTPGTAAYALNVATAGVAALLAAPTFPPIIVGPSRQVTLNGQIGMVAAVSGVAIFTPSG